MNFTRLGLPLLMLVLLFSVYKAEAAVMIDDFQYVQDVSDNNSVSANSTVDGLGSVTRTLISVFGTDIGVGGGFLDLSNRQGYAETLRIVYEFGNSTNGIDLDDIAEAFSFNVYSVLVKADLEIIAKNAANDSSKFLINNLVEGQYRVGFSQFVGEKDVFSHLTSLELKFSGDQDWSVVLKGGLSAVPEPSVSALLIIGLLAFTCVGRKRFPKMLA